jgi:hypothetical protein
VHDDDLEGCGAAYVSTFRWGEGRTSIRRLLASAYVSTSRREHIRMAIGQIADYRRFVVSQPTCKVLLPEAPAPELLDLLWSQRIGVIVRGGADDFTELLPSP